MELPYSDAHLHIETPRTQVSSPLPPLLFVHGFAGSTEDWTPVIQSLTMPLNCYLLDLPGSGKSGVPSDFASYQFPALLDAIDAFRREIGAEAIIPVGYSMGGRIALSYAAKYPGAVAALIAASSTIGIEDEAERAERLEADEELADFIEREGIEAFSGYWSRLPLFQKEHPLSHDLQMALLERILHNDSSVLAKQMRGLGTGAMEPLHDALSDLDVPVLLISGSEDEKFLKLNKALRKLLPNAVHEIVPDCGHRVYFENPALFTELLQNFLEELK